MKPAGLVFLVAAAAIAALAPSAFARPKQGLFGTWWDAKDARDNGLGLGYRMDFPVASFASVDTRLSWVRFSDDDINVLPLEVGGLLRLGMLYAGGGVGYYFFDNDIDSHSGGFALGGVNVGAGSVGIFLEVKWTSLSADTNFPAPLGAPGGVPGGTHDDTFDADGIGFNVGVTFGGIPGK